jgi:hypothetical protein
MIVWLQPQRAASNDILARSMFEGGRRHEVFSFVVRVKDTFFPEFHSKISYESGPEKMDRTEGHKLNIKNALHLYCSKITSNCKIEIVLLVVKLI